MNPKIVVHLLTIAGPEWVPCMHTHPAGTKPPGFPTPIWRGYEMHSDVLCAHGLIQRRLLTDGGTRAKALCVRASDLTKPALGIYQYSRTKWGTVVAYRDDDSDPIYMAACLALSDLKLINLVVKT